MSCDERRLVNIEEPLWQAVTIGCGADRGNFVANYKGSHKYGDDSVV